MPEGQHEDRSLLRKACRTILTCYLVCLGGAGFATAALASEAFGKLHSRQQHEMVELFQVILRAFDAKPKPCEFSTEWDKTEISSSDLRKYLGEMPNRGHSLQGKIKPADVLDPMGAMTEAFCTEEKAQAQEQAFLRENRDGTALEEKQAGNSDRPAEISRSRFGLPIFNAAFTRAVIYRENKELGTVWPRQAKAPRPSVELAGWIDIFHKRRGKWFPYKRELFFAS